MATHGRTEKAPVHSGERVRQGYIALRKPWQRWVFFGGLAGFVLLAIFGRLMFGA